MTGSGFARQVLTDRRTSVAAFVMLAIAVFAAASLASWWIALVTSPGLLATAVTIDLLVTIPVAFYFLVARRYSLSFATVAPVVGAGWLAAYYFLPSTHRTPLYFAEVAAVAMEAGVIFWIGRRIWRASRQAGARSADFLDRARKIAVEVLQNRTLGAMAATELAMFYYLTIGWFRRPRESADDPAFNCYRRSGQGGIVLVLILLFAVEGTVAHLLISRWSVTIAWIVTALTIYGGLWIIGDWRATVLRPTRITGESLVVRAGLRFDLEIPIGAIREIARTRPDEGKSISTVLLSEPEFWIVCEGEITGRGLLGLPLKCNAVGLTPDAPELFVEALERAKGKETGDGRQETGDRRQETGDTSFIGRRSLTNF